MAEVRFVNQHVCVVLFSLSVPHADDFLQFNNHVLRRVLPAPQCIPPSASQLTGCALTSSESVLACSFSGLAQVNMFFFSRKSDCLPIFLHDCDACKLM